MDKIKNTENIYSFLWTKTDKNKLPSKWHFSDIQDLISESIVRGNRGIELGSGCGYDTFTMAVSNPLVKIASLDISAGIYKTKELTRGLKNVLLIRGSALEVPVKDGVFDFAYSFGVLHHTPDPEKGIKEISRIIKQGAPVFLYLYEDHSDNPIKYFAIKITSAVRKVTTRIPPKLMYAISYLASPFIVLLFTYPAKIFKRFKVTQDLADKMPFNFGTHPFSVADDLYDRFSPPLEYRFNRQELFDLLQRSGFINIRIEKLKTKAGWVAWGYKK